MTGHPLLHQTNEQTRWHSLAHGVRAAVLKAAGEAAGRGMSIHTDSVETYITSLSEKFSESARLHVGFFEHDGIPELALARVTLFTSASPYERPLGWGTYSSRHLGTLDVAASNSEDKGVLIKYRAGLNGAVLQMVFSSPPGTDFELAQLSHVLVDDFALSVPSKVNR